MIVTAMNIRGGEDKWQQKHRVEKEEVEEGHSDQ